MAQSKRFSGFEEADFEIFDIKNLKKRKKAIKNRIRPKLKLLAKEVLPRFESHNGLPVPLCSHYARHDRNFVNLPSATWLALGRYQGKYVNYAQLNVGLSKQFGVIIRLGFEVKEESVDIWEFKKWINICNNRGRLGELKQNKFKFFLGKQYVKNKEILYKIEEIASMDKALPPEEADSKIFEIPGADISRPTSFEIGKQYNKDDDIVTSLKLVGEVIKVFKKLYPIYKEIGQAE